MQHGGILLIHDPRDVLLAVAPTLAQQALDLKTATQIKFSGPEIRLKQGQVTAGCAIRYALGQGIGPRTVPVFVSIELATAALIGGMRCFYFCKPVRVKGPKSTANVVKGNRLIRVIARCLMRALSHQLQCKTDIAHLHQCAVV